ncbi:MAG: class I tRNA ligase family protein, partial [Candidatus Pacearchaeota archaeon]|nr:class I tRNA ligase family protein [Candidatus Pacearchaeota archaeon]
IKDFDKNYEKNILDEWILSRLNELVKEVTENMEKYNLPGATRPITDFIEDLSNWYLRQTRERLNEQNVGAFRTLQEVLLVLSKLIAPFMPFTAEYVWQKVTGSNFEDKNKSVHLEKWPAVYEEINNELLAEMKKVREIVSLGLKQRDQNQFGLKWPLSNVKVWIKEGINNDFNEIIKSQLNVKDILVESNEEFKVELDFNLTPELESEGYAREISRHVQAFRKQLGLQKKDKIELFLFLDESLKKIIESQEAFIKERTNADKFSIEVATLKEKFKNKIDFKIKEKRGTIAIKF